MDLLSVYQEQYFKSLEHSQRLDGKMGSSLTFLTVFGTGNILVWRQYFIYKVDEVFLTLCLLSLLGFILCLVTAIRTYSGYHYAYFPTAQISQRVSETYTKAEGNPDAKKQVDDHINKLLIETYLKCVTQNELMNEMKNTRHNYLACTVLIAFVSLAIAFIYNVAVIENTHLVF